jgi:hypothetical protein
MENGEDQGDLDCNEEWGRFVMCRSIRNRCQQLYSNGEMNKDCAGRFNLYTKCIRAKTPEDQAEVYQHRRSPITLDKHPWNFKPDYIALLDAQKRILVNDSSDREREE